MKLREWDKIINEFKSVPEIDVNFLMVINSCDITEIKKLLKQNNFQHTVSIDTIGKFDKMNTLPSQTQFQTFLLDSQNEVVAIGNPVYNPKIKDLYEHILSEEVDYSSQINEYGGICDNAVRALGVVNKGDTIRKIFRLSNDEFENLTLQDMVPSCYCISGDADFSAIRKETHGDINVEYVADTVSQPIYQYLDVYFKECKIPVRLILHGFIK